MALSNFSYSPAISGSSIDNAVKGACSSLNPEGAGKVYWQTVISLLYGDFTSTLANNLLTYLQQTQVLFLPVPPQSLIFLGPPILTVFTSMISTSSLAIDSNIKSACSGQSASISLNITFWKEVFKKIYQDIHDNITQPIVDAYNTAICTALTGSLATGTLGLVAPIPCYIPPANLFLASDLTAKLDVNFNELMANAAAMAVHNQIQSRFSSYTTKEQQNTIGAIYWQIFLDQLKSDISSFLQDDIRNFILSNPMHYAIPMGSPGLSPLGAPIPSTADTFGTMF